MGFQTSLKKNLRDITPSYIFAKRLDSLVSWLVKQLKESSLEVIFDN